MSEPVFHINAPGLSQDEVTALVVALEVALAPRRPHAATDRVSASGWASHYRSYRPQPLPGAWRTVVRF